MPLLTLKQVQERLVIARPQTVSKLIRAGLLKAIDVSPNPNRHWWRITEEALAEFMEQRTAKPETPEPRSRKRRSKARQYY